MRQIIADKINLLLLIVMLALVVSGCKTDLYTKISEPEANEMLSVLANAGIRSSKTSPDGKTWSVLIEESEIPKALEALRAQGLPRDRHQSLGDIFKKEGLVSTPSEERIRFTYAMSQELSRTLSQIDGVITARVHVVIPNNDPLAEKTKPSSASVFIKHRPSLSIQTITPAIKTLVQRSIEGLGYENISVLFFPADALHDAVPVDPGVIYYLFWYEWLILGLTLWLIAFLATLAHPKGRKFLKGIVTAMGLSRKSAVADVSGKS